MKTVPLDRNEYKRVRIACTTPKGDSADHSKRSK